MSFLNKIFGKKSNSEPLNFSDIGVDIHSHLIPGIDDGSQSMEESIELIRGMKEMGYRKLITTPHIQNDKFKNNAEIILSGLDNVKRELDKNKIEIEIEAAAEYLIDDGFLDKLRNGKLMTFGDNYLLVELSYYSEPFNLKNIFFELQTSGYKVILAHPERYIYWHNNLDVYDELRNRGIYLQLNINSLTGWYSKESKQVAEKLINKNLISLLGSDTHNTVYLNELRNSAYQSFLRKALETNKILNYKF